MHRLRIAGRKEQYANHPAWKRLVAQTAMTLLWPFGALVTALLCGRDEHASLARILDAWWLALRHNVPPLEYFLHRLWQPERQGRLDDYIYWTENASILMALNRAAGWRPGPDPVSDKRRFSAFCSALGLWTPQLFALWSNGRHEEGEALPKQDLWLKPTNGKSGIGAERWIWQNGAFWRDGQALSPNCMADHIAAHSRSHHASLVQAVIRAHADHAPLIGDAPLCARILTGRRRDGCIEIVAAMANWPCDGRVITQGGSMTMIDMLSGRLGAIHDAAGRVPNSKLEGQQLPDWLAALQAVQKGHANLPHYVFLGWDVAFGADGPVLLETNSGWGCFHFQVLPDRPIADTSFAAIAAEYL